MLQTYIVLLRGINVSGQKKVPMAELRALLERLNFKNVQTYIQSGNVVFRSPEKDKNNLENIIKKAIIAQFGFDVPVLVKTEAQLESIFNNCPFSEAKKEKSYFTLLHAVPQEKLMQSAQSQSFPNEEIRITKNCVYFYSEIGYGKAKCNNNFLERKLKVTATTRNYKTMMKLLTLS